MDLINIKESLKYKNILITGGTGFLGKVLIEKLIRDCTEISSIFILLRGNNKMKFSERCEEFIKCEIFNRIRETDDKQLGKLQFLEADFAAESQLNLTESNVNILINKIHIIYHCAATVSFSDNLKNSILINTRGTQQIVELAEKMKKLEAFIHISTAYSNCDHKFIEERIYKPIIDSNLVIEACATDNQQMINYIGTLYRPIYPNPYVFSKNLSESIIYNAKDKIPVTILRPSIVTPSYVEPYPGWVDSLNGPMAMVAAAYTGILRSYYGLSSRCSDMVPVDYVVNSIIAVSANMINNHTNKTIDNNDYANNSFSSISDRNIIYENNRKNNNINHHDSSCIENYDKSTSSSKVNSKCLIYNCTTGLDAPISWNQFINLANETHHKYPSEMMLWSPGGKMHSSFILFFIHYLLVQLLPAIIIDSILFVIGRKRFLVRIQLKIFAAIVALRPFLKKDWKFSNDNLKKLFNKLSSDDQKAFNFDACSINYRTYVEHWIHGTRKFIMKYNDSTIAQSKLKLRRMIILDRIVRYAFYCCIFIGIYFYSTNLNSYLINNWKKSSQN